MPVPQISSRKYSLWGSECESDYPGTIRTKQVLAVKPFFVILDTIRRNCGGSMRATKPGPTLGLLFVSLITATQTSAQQSDAAKIYSQSSNSVLLIFTK